MIEWFTEDALLPTILGGFLAICMFGLYFYSSEKIMLWIALLVTIGTVGIATIERMVVTDKEKAYTMLYDAARAGTRNDDTYLLSLIKSDKVEEIARARTMLEDVTFENVRVAGIKAYESSDLDSAKTASISIVTFGSGRYRNNSGPFNVQVDLELEMVNDQWKVVDFETSNPRAGYGL
jgi:hypothetical protein